MTRWLQWFVRFWGPFSFHTEHYPDTYTWAIRAGQSKVLVAEGPANTRLFGRVLFIWLWLKSKGIA